MDLESGTALDDFMMKLKPWLSVSALQWPSTEGPQVCHNHEQRLKVIDTPSVND